MTETQQGMIDACKSAPDVDVADSKHHPILQKKATECAQHQAQRQEQGHHYWTSTYWHLQKNVGRKYKYYEVTAESWPDQKNYTPEELGQEFIKCWKQSKGHWNIVRSRHRFFGADMAQGKNGIWYACIIVGD